jgi:hypothetical protein
VPVDIELQPKESGLVATDENVVKFCHALVLLQKKIVDQDTLERMLLKFIAFRDSQEG